MYLKHAKLMFHKYEVIFLYNRFEITQDINISPLSTSEIDTKNSISNNK